MSNPSILAAGLSSGLLVGFLDAAEVVRRIARDSTLGSMEAHVALNFVSGSAATYGFLGLLVALLFSTLVGHARDGRVASILAVTVVVALPLLVWANTSDGGGVGLLAYQSLRYDVIAVGCAAIVALVLTSRLKTERAVLALGRVGWIVWGTMVLGFALTSTGTRGAVASDVAAPNVLVIGVDTLRADRLGAYGYWRPTSPNIDRLARDGVLYEHCVSPTSNTAPAHASLWTGRYPHEHGVIDNGYSLSQGADVLAQRLSERGYDAVGYVSNQMIDAPKGFAQGFRTYFATGAKTTFSGPSFQKAPPFQWWHSLKVVVLMDKLLGRDLVERAAASYLLREARLPFFMFVQFTDPHSPYDPQRRFVDGFRRGDRMVDASEGGLQRVRDGRRAVDREEVQALEDLYDAEVRQVDEEIGRVLNALAASGLAARTLVVLWADHGENMYEERPLPGRTDGFRNVFGHGHQLYESLVHVPLILRWPGRLPAGLRVREPLSTVQVRGLLEALFASNPGEDAPVVPPRTGPVFGEVFAQPTQSYSVQNGHWKLVRYEWDGGVVDELYDVGADPREGRSLSAERATELSALRAILDPWVEDNARQVAIAHKRHRPLFDDDTQRQLRALGYVN